MSITFKNVRGQIWLGENWFYFTLNYLISRSKMLRMGSMWQHFKTPLIAGFMGPTWGPAGADRTQVGPMLAPWTLLSGTPHAFSRRVVLKCCEVLANFASHISAPYCPTLQPWFCFILTNIANHSCAPYWPTLQTTAVLHADQHCKPELCSIVTNFANHNYADQLCNPPLGSMRTNIASHNSDPY